MEEVVGGHDGDALGIELIFCGGLGFGGFCAVVVRYLHIGKCKKLQFKAMV